MSNSEDSAEDLQAKLNDIEKEYAKLKAEYSSKTKECELFEDKYDQLKKDYSDLEKKCENKIPPPKDIQEEALQDLHSLVYHLSEHGSVVEQRKAYETFLKYVKDPVVKAEVLNNLACIYSQVDNDFEKAKEYFKAAVEESEKAAEQDMDISTERLKEYRSNLYICEEKIRFAGRPGLNWKGKNIEEELKKIKHTLKDFDSLS